MHSSIPSAIRRYPNQHPRPGVYDCMLSIICNTLSDVITRYSQEYIPHVISGHSREFKRHCQA